jgi:hypothetical protein
MEYDFADSSSEEENTPQNSPVRKKHGLRPTASGGRTKKEPNLAPRIKTIGSRDDVYSGKAKKTSGGLTKDMLCLNSKGKVVSKKASAAGRRAYSQHLQKYHSDRKQVAQAISKRQKFMSKIEE